MTVKYVVITTSPFPVPSDFGSLVSIEALGAGQAGKPGSSADGGAGGKGGYYCKITSAVNIAANNSLTVQLGSAGIGNGGNGGDTYLEDNTNTQIIVAPGGNSATTAIGLVKNAGGLGGGGGSGGGGGGGSSGGTAGVGNNGEAGTSGQLAGGVSPGFLADGITPIGAGGNGGPFSNTAGSPGDEYGGGGGGGGRSGNQPAGGNGYQGVILFAYNTAATTPFTYFPFDHPITPSPKGDWLWQQINANQLAWAQILPQPSYLPLDFYRHPPPPAPSADWITYLPNQLALGSLITPEPPSATFLPLDFYRHPPPPTPSADWTWLQVNNQYLANPIYVQALVISQLPLDFYRHPPAPTPSADWLWQTNANQLELLNQLNFAFVPFDWPLYRAPNPPHPIDFMWPNLSPTIATVALNFSFVPYPWHLQRAPDPRHPPEFTFPNLVLQAGVLQLPTRPSKVHRHPAPPTPSEFKFWMTNLLPGLLQTHLPTVPSNLITKSLGSPWPWHPHPIDWVPPNSGQLALLSISKSYQPPEALVPKFIRNIEPSLDQVRQTSQPLTQIRKTS